MIDDGSIDNSFNICNSYVKKDSKFHVFHQNNKGVGITRNQGIERSHGELIFFLDADDYLEPNALEVLHEYWLDSCSPIVIGGIYKVNSNGGKLRKFSGISGIFGKEWIADKIWSYLQDYDNYAVSHCWGRLYERKFIERYQIQFPEGVKVGEDGVFNIKCLTYADNIMVINEPLYNFQLHNESSSVVAINNNQMDLDALRDTLGAYFINKVGLFIENLSKRTKEWGKSNG
jgi:glycosyltransferase involved in cell wall biosynthesis